MSTINVQSITNGTDSIDVADAINGSAKAWAVCNVNTVLNSHNVSAVTSLNGLGGFRVTFATPMPNSQYVVVTSVSVLSGDYTSFPTTRTTSYFDVQTVAGGNGEDAAFLCAVFGD